MTWRELLFSVQEDEALDDQEVFFLLLERARQNEIELYQAMDDSIAESLLPLLEDDLERLRKKEPLAYILGFQPFYGYDFRVTPDVLIPRPETEELCALVLQLKDTYFSGRKDPLVLFDVATGSGAIGVTLSLEDDQLDVFASDLSENALEVARENSRNLDGRVIFLQGDFLEPFIDRNMHCDILVCNPPYIPDDELPEDSVIGYEPHLALFGGEKGLKGYRSVLSRASEVLNDTFLMAFEIGWQQGEDLKQMAASFFPEATIEIHQDLSGKDRMLTVYQDGSGSGLR